MQNVTDGSLLTELLLGKAVIQRPSSSGTGTHLRVESKLEHKDANMPQNYDERTGSSRVKSHFYRDGTLQLDGFNQN